MGSEREERLETALSALTDAWYGLWVSNHAKFTPDEIAWAQRIEAEARAAIEHGREVIADRYPVSTPTLNGPSVSP